MARDFTKNTSNYLNLGANTIGNLMNGASAVSVHLWATADSITEGNNAYNRLISSMVNGTTTNGLTLSMGANTGSNYNLVVKGRSVSTDGLQQAVGTTVLTPGTLYSFGGVLNFGGDSITPYVNGSAEGGASVTFGNATYTQGTATTNDAIGAYYAPAPDTERQWDGLIAEVAMWNIDIGVAGFTQLAKGFSAILIHPEALIFYMPLIGRASPEIELINAKTGAITGTINALAHPRIFYPTKAQIKAFG